MLRRQSTHPFQNAPAHFNDLQAEATEGLISNAADIALILDHDGIIQDLAISEEDLADHGCLEWIGKPWLKTVTVESQTKVETALSEAISTGVSKRREINHPRDGTSDLPIRYLVTQIPDQDRLIAFGQDLRHAAALQQRLINAQLEMEREYAKLRQAESRYRLLFQMGTEATLIIDGQNATILEANGAAAELLGSTAQKLVGRKLPQVFEAEDRDTIRALVGSASALGRTTPVTVNAGPHGESLDISVSTFRQGTNQYALVRMAPNDAELEPIVTRDRLNTLKVLDTLPDGFVVIDEQRNILEANTAFLDMIQVASLDQIRGQSLEKWFERPSVDFNVLVANLREHGTVRRFPTVLQGAHGSLEQVEIAAVNVSNEAGPIYGLVIRDVGAVGRSTGVAEQFQPQSIDQLADLIGHMSLKEVVRETTDVIERMCIEAALRLTNDNRASAAQMLGLSRQSLYAKLNRFGLSERADRS
ncbi:MAG: transcriptional regulator PpsR [Pseudomonadota bacterium]